LIRSLRSLRSLRSRSANRWRSGLLLAWLASCALTGPTAHVFAQEPNAKDEPAADGKPRAASDERAASFEAVSGAVKEDIAGGPLMLAAYAVVWLAVFGYVFRLVRMHRSIEDELSRVERAIETASSKGAG
jgi:CcmD family protein